VCSLRTWSISTLALPGIQYLTFVVFKDCREGFRFQEIQYYVGHVTVVKFRNVLRMSAFNNSGIYAVENGILFC